MKEGIFQASVNMDSELRNDIQEIADREDRSFAKVAYSLLQQAIKERKRIAAKNARKREIPSE